jgi:uncharacterized protein
MVQDRKLGDEWNGWNGDLVNTELDVEAGKRVFMSFAILSIFILDISIAFIWYLIKPRIEQLNLAFSLLLGKLILVFIIILFICFLLTVLSIITKKNLLIGFRSKKFSITFLTPLILSLGKKCGISYDRMGNSFIKVSNSLLKATRRNISNSKVLILLPRCLTKNLQTKIKSLAEQYNCSIFTVPGGELARKIIERERPMAVIGVACERDLMSGMQDVHQIPVIGIPNIRPEGPCKNTLVDYNKIEEAICYFLNKKPRLGS